MAPNVTLRKLSNTGWSTRAAMGWVSGVSPLRMFTAIVLAVALGVAGVAGGMAVIYSATHVETDEAAALKVLPAAWGDSAEFRLRLEREAAALRRIKHPNVVQVFHVGEVDATAGGGCFLAMEWLPHALDRVLLARYPEPLPTPHALQLTSHVAHALAAAHDAGFVHATSSRPTFCCAPTAPPC